MAKLGIYLVTTKQDGKPSAIHLVISESAEMAGSRIFDAVGYFGEIAEVGRLGDYEPGIEGHHLVVSRPNSAYVMREELA